MLPTTEAGGPYTITADSQQYGVIVLTDIMFGNVWICGGQSNMAFTLSGVYNATDEIKKAANYSVIRLFTVTRNISDKPLQEFVDYSQHWVIASPDTVKDFSAVCWFFGRDLHDKLKMPIGLISSNWGGTPIEAWSSAAALKYCPSDKSNPSKVSGPNSRSVLWNAMINPLINLTISGVIWYQGEANRDDPLQYNCTFPAMINDWSCLLYTSPSPRDRTRSRMPSSA